MDNDTLVKSRHPGEGDCVAIAESAINTVIPAKAGIQTSSRRRPGTRTLNKSLDSGLRRNDESGVFSTFYEFIGNYYHIL